MDDYIQWDPLACMDDCIQWGPLTCGRLFSVGPINLWTIIYSSNLIFIWCCYTGYRIKKSKSFICIPQLYGFQSNIYIFLFDLVNFSYLNLYKVIINIEGCIHTGYPKRMILKKRPETFKSADYSKVSLVVCLQYNLPSI